MVAGLASASQKYGFAGADARFYHTGQKRLPGHSQVLEKNGSHVPNALLNIGLKETGNELTTSQLITTTKVARHFRLSENNSSQ